MLLSVSGVGLGALLTHSPAHFGETASSVIEREGGWTSFIQNFIFGGLVVKLQYQAIEGIDSVGGLLLAPVRALGRGMVRLVDATIGGVVAVFGAGTEATVRSFTDGIGALLGPLAQPTSVGIGMLSVAVFIYTVNKLNISPISFLRGLRG
jgi:hypothetical protein